MVTTDLLERIPVGEMYVDMPNEPTVLGYTIDSASLKALGDPEEYFRNFKKAIGIGEDFGGSQEKELPFRIGAYTVELVYVRRPNEIIYTIGLENSPLLGYVSLNREVVISFIDHDDPDQPVTAEWRRHNDTAKHQDGYSHPINSESMRYVTTVKSMLKLGAS